MTHIYISNLFQPFLNKKIFRSFWTKNRNRIHHFWDLRDSRTGISAILNRRVSRLNDFFSNFFLYQLFGHPMNCILNQSDEKSDQPGILGLGDPLKFFTSSQKAQFRINRKKGIIFNSFLELEVENQKGVTITSWSAPWFKSEIRFKWFNYWINSLYFGAILISTPRLIQILLYAV